LRALLGNGGFVLGAVLFVIIGNPWSGFTSAPELLPGAVATIGQLLPPGAGGSMLRSVAFFDGNGAAGHMLVLTVWAAAGLAAVCAGTGLPRAAQGNLVPVGASSARPRDGMGTLEPLQTLGPPELFDPPESFDPPEPFGSPDSFGSRGTFGPPESPEPPESLDALESFGPPDSLDPPEPFGPPELVDTTELVYKAKLADIRRLPAVATDPVATPTRDDVVPFGLEDLSGLPLAPSRRR
jgi:hypothetical protein